MSLAKTHYLNVGPKGTFHDSSDVQTLPQDVDAIIDLLQDRGLQKIAIHFHGGLIKESAGMKIADKMVPVFRDAGSHAVTFVWETGLLETISRNIGSIYQTKLFRKLLKLAIRHAGKRLGGVGGRGPGMTIPYAEIETELAKEIPFQDFNQSEAESRGAGSLSETELEDSTADLEQEIEEDMEVDADEIDVLLRTEAPTTDLLDQARINEALTEEQSRGISTFITVARAVAVIVKEVIRRYIRKTHHGFYPTVVEEVLRYYYLADLGAWVWGGMKTAAQNMWLPNDGLDGPDQHAGTYFLERLSALQANRPELVIDLVGHSAGSIAICEMLKAAHLRQTPIKLRNILFLAPACTAELMSAEIVSHPERYGHFRMFTMRDDYESDDVLVKGVYTRSLLYFISGVLEQRVDEHVAGMQRYLSGQKPYDREPFLGVKRFLEQPGENRLVLSNSEQIAPNAPAGHRSTAEAHGAFDDDIATRSSLTAIIKQ